MKMLLIVYRESLEEEIHGLLQQHGVSAFTELQHVAGAGETGRAFHSFTWPGTNGLILTALPDTEANRLLQGLKSYRDERVKEQHGAKFPLRVFTFPCDLAV
jgi:hypothetical protein